jgi:hypothetical protein
MRCDVWPRVGRQTLRVYRNEQHCTLRHCNLSISPSRARMLRGLHDRAVRPTARSWNVDKRRLRRMRGSGSILHAVLRCSVARYLDDTTQSSPAAHSYTPGARGECSSECAAAPQGGHSGSAAVGGSAVLLYARAQRRNDPTGVRCCGCSSPPVDQEAFHGGRATDRREHGCPCCPCFGGRSSGATVPSPPPRARGAAVTSTPGRFRRGITRSPAHHPFVREAQ